MKALVKYKASLAIAPKGTGALYNGGLCAYLAGYFKDLHELYGMYNGEPACDDIRKQVIQILEKKRKALAAAVKKDGEAKDTGKKDGEKKPAKDSDQAGCAICLRARPGFSPIRVPPPRPRR